MEISAMVLLVETKFETNVLFFKKLPVVSLRCKRSIYHIENPRP